MARPRTSRHTNTTNAMTMTRKKIAVLTGAGMSAESGLKTFRDAGGLWEEYPVEQVASHEGWIANPSLVTRFYNERRRQLLSAEPNKGHRLVAGLERTHDVTVVTQNVDNLHERAGSSNVIHLHGELMKVCSSRDPYDPQYIRTLTAGDWEVADGALAGDGSLLRPFIVFFGEAVPAIEQAAQAVAQADMMIIIGTSLNVYPAAGLIHYAKADAPIYLIDPKPVAAGRRVHQIMKGASDGMEELAKTLAGE